MENIGEIIKKFRKNKGLNQQELAKKLGLTVQSLCRMETGKNKIHTQHLEEICDVLGIHVLEFWNEVFGQNKKEEPSRDIPIVGYVNSQTKSRNIIWSNEGLPVSNPIGVVSTLTNMPDTNFYALIIDDNTMDPFEAGWIVVVDPNAEIQNRDHVIVRHNESVLLRRIVIEDKTSFSLHATKSFETPLKLSRLRTKVLHKAWCFVAR
ncbi:MAG: LexA family transcriptional regulator [Deltaproteobacteria bacterium]|nr:LexA family transcriptional regulator [Deltaproteobacteria bacterium]